MSCACTHSIRYPPTVGGNRKVAPHISEGWGGNRPPRIQTLGGAVPPQPRGGTAKITAPPSAWGGNIQNLGSSPPETRCSPPRIGKILGGFWGGTDFGVVVPPQDPTPWGGTKWCPPISRDPGGAVPISFPPSPWGCTGNYALMIVCLFLEYEFNVVCLIRCDFERNTGHPVSL